MNEVVTHWIRGHGLPDEEAEIWYKEAEAWRLPYWDWAARQTYAEDFACPEVLVQGPVRIYPPALVRDRYPEGGLYANPFWGFNNPVRYEDGEDQGDPRPFGDMPESLKEWNIPQTEQRDRKTGVLEDILPVSGVTKIAARGRLPRSKHGLRANG